MRKIIWTCLHKITYTKLQQNPLNNISTTYNERMCAQYHYYIRYIKMNECLDSGTLLYIYGLVYKHVVILCMVIYTYFIYGITHLNIKE